MDVVGISTHKDEPTIQSLITNIRANKPPTDAEWKTSISTLCNHILSFNIGRNYSTSCPVLLITLVKALAHYQYDYNREDIYIINRHPLTTAEFKLNEYLGVPNLNIRICAPGNPDIHIGITTSTFTIEQQGQRRTTGKSCSTTGNTGQCGSIGDPSTERL